MTLNGDKYMSYSIVFLYCISEKYSTVLYFGEILYRNVFRRNTVRYFVESRSRNVIYTKVTTSQYLAVNCAISLKLFPKIAAQARRQKKNFSEFKPPKCTLVVAKKGCCS